MVLMKKYPKDYIYKCEKEIKWNETGMFWRTRWSDCK